MDWQSDGRLHCHSCTMAYVSAAATVLTSSVEQSVILEIKSVEHIAPLYASQLLTYLRLSDCQVGPPDELQRLTLKDGQRPFVL